MRSGNSKWVFKHKNDPLKEGYVVNLDESRKVIRTTRDSNETKRRMVAAIFERICEIFKPIKKERKKMKIQILRDTQIRVNGKTTPVKAKEVYDGLHPKEVTDLIMIGAAELLDATKVRLLYHDEREGFRKNAVMEFKPLAAQNLIREGKAEIYNQEGGDTLPQEELVKVKILRDTSIRGEVVSKDEIRFFKPSIATEVLELKCGTLEGTGVEKIRVQFMNSIVFAGGKIRDPNTSGEIPTDEAEALIKKGRAQFYGTSTPSLAREFPQGKGLTVKGI